MGKKFNIYHEALTSGSLLWNAFQNNSSPPWCSIIGMRWISIACGRWTGSALQLKELRGMKWFTYIFPFDHPRGKPFGTISLDSINANTDAKNRIVGQYSQQKALENTQIATIFLKLLAHCDLQRHTRACTRKFNRRTPRSPGTILPSNSSGTEKRNFRITFCFSDFHFWCGNLFASIRPLVVEYLLWYN